MTYIQFNDLTDFDESHMFVSNQDDFVGKELQNMIKDPEEWHL